ncbi:Cytochrome P450 [Naviculisporaceae sp. PSN 640]
MVVLSLVNSLHDNSFLLGAIGASLLGLLCRLLMITQFRAKFPKELGLVGEKPGKKTFSLRNRLTFYFNCSKLYNDVWHKFSKRNLPVLVPTLGTRREVFLPHSSIKWLLSQPSSVLGMWDAFSEIFQIPHSLGHDKYMLETWAVDTSRFVLTQDLERFLEPVREELELAIDSLLGKGEDNWKSLDLFDTVRRIVNQAGSRFVVGAPLCRDEDYLTAGVGAIDDIITCAGIVGFFPPFLRPVAGFFTRRRTNRMLRVLERHYDPMLQKRFAHIRANPDDKSNDPVDLLQCMLRDAQKDHPEELDTPTMTRRILMAKLGFIYQVGFACTNLVRNILESDAQYDTVSVLRDEAVRMRAESESFPVDPQTGSKLWTRKNVARMVHADSAMRETLRLDAFPTRALIRQVMVDGLHIDTGLALPKGSLVSVVSQPMHTDPELFVDAHHFDPYRFLNLRNQDGNSASKATATRQDEIQDGYNPSGKNWNQHAFLSTSNLLIFGRGRFSCPGRFLVDFQMKMLIAHLLTHYDLKLAEGNPPPRKVGEGWLLEFIPPPKGIKIFAKRRSVSGA